MWSSTPYTIRIMHHHTIWRTETEHKQIANSFSASFCFPHLDETTILPQLHSPALGQFPLCSHLLGLQRWHGWHWTFDLNVIIIYRALGCSRFLTFAHASPALGLAKMLPAIHMFLTSYTWTVQIEKNSEYVCNCIKLYFQVLQHCNTTTSSGSYFIVTVLIVCFKPKLRLTIFHLGDDLCKLFSR